MQNFEQTEFTFDVVKLRKALKQVETKVEQQSPLGFQDGGAVCLTQIPGDPNSITGGNVVGLYWTRPDSTYKEVQREEPINEASYSEFVKLLEDTYFKEVYNTLLTKYKLGRVRLIWKNPRSTISWHRDPERRLHIPIVTNPGCIAIIDTEARHLEADGKVWITNNTKYHTALNGGEEIRVHFIATVLD